MNIGGILWAVFWAVVVIGWCGNIIRLAAYMISLPHLADMSGFCILRIVGVFVGPLGVLLGFVPN